MSIVYQPHYPAKQLTVYTKNSRGGGWNEWRMISEKRACGPFVNVDIWGNHDKFICLRFNDWTNRYVGICQVSFQFVSNMGGYANDIPSAPPPEYEIVYDPQSEPGMYNQPPPAYTVGSDAIVERAETFGIEGGGGATGVHHVIDIGGAPQSAVATWLNGLGPTFCSEYLHLFEENGFDDMDIVATMNDTDLRSIGISKLGHRRKMLMEIEKINL